jgi:hypothetical protein
MATVTCHTDGCENNGIPIEMDLTFTDDEDNVHTVGSVSCGPCGQPITDIEHDDETESEAAP